MMENYGRKLFFGFMIFTQKCLLIQPINVVVLGTISLLNYWFP